MQEANTEHAADAERLVMKYGTMLYRICIGMLGNQSDAEDAVQNTFLAYLQKTPTFTSDEHEKAWLIKVASNNCRNMKRFRLTHKQVEITDILHYLPDEQSVDIIEALMKIPDKFRIVMILYQFKRFSERLNLFIKSSSYFILVYN